MRLWSLHPKYLDTKGLVALWREGLLAQKVIEEPNRGYHYHPQLRRFRATPEPSYMVSLYLRYVWAESRDRGHNFNKHLINGIRAKRVQKIPVTKGQFYYELDHLADKLEIRCEESFKKLCMNEEFDPHPMFKIIPGEIEEWEKVKKEVS